MGDVADKNGKADGDAASLSNSPESGAETESLVASESSSDRSTAAAKGKGKARRDKSNQSKKILQADTDSSSFSPVPSSSLSDCSDNADEKDSDVSEDGSGEKDDRTAVTKGKPTPQQTRQQTNDKVKVKGKKSSKEKKPSSAKASKGVKKAEAAEDANNAKDSEDAKDTGDTKDTKDDNDDKDTKDAKGNKSAKEASGKPKYFCADEIWDEETRDYKLVETAERAESYKAGDYVFHVRRHFDRDEKNEETYIDFKSRALCAALQPVLGHLKAVSLSDETPVLAPETLFLYIEKIRAQHVKLCAKSVSAKEKKERKLASRQAAEVKLLVKYIDKKFATLKKSLTPLLKAGKITFDLIWTLFPEQEVIYTHTYSATDEPRAFKVENAVKDSSWTRGEYFLIEGVYLDFNGKYFGSCPMVAEIDAFKGVRPINSLACYPLKYHKEAAAMETQMVERGKKFVSLAGMKYAAHLGLAFEKGERRILKVSTNTRIMVDPRTFRRILPNYVVPMVKSEDSLDGLPCHSIEEGGSEDESSCSGAMDETPTCLKLFMDKDENPRIVDIQRDDKGNEISSDETEKLLNEGFELKREFTKEHLLLASPLVFGFSFSDKLWLEFTVSGVRDITWNEDAFDSLVLPARQKSIVKALVRSQTANKGERNTVDDVIRGKGRGLVALLHGTPGVGKTLTAESIAELLKRPLYAVSAGELGTNPAELEVELNKIMDVSHTWGAVLLLDEADVFMEARTAQDIRRNALVSIFLRVLEYFQGILFLTTNRVNTFDDAFQSRIHFALKYHELDFQTRRTIYKMFIGRVAQTGTSSNPSENSADATEQALSANASDVDTGSSGSGTPPEVPSSPATPAKDSIRTSADSKSSSGSSGNSSRRAMRAASVAIIGNDAVEAFSETDLDRLARREGINGRRIKNTVRSAQALAIDEGVPMSMEHLLTVLEVADEFERDLKGCGGDFTAMSSYI